MNQQLRNQGTKKECHFKYCLIFILFSTTTVLVESLKHKIQFMKSIGSFKEITYTHFFSLF